MSISPNPFSDATIVRFAVARAAAVELKILDATGRSVRTLLEGERGQGVYWVTWDGRDEWGRLLPAGLYFPAMRAEGRRVGQRVLLLH